MDNSKIKTELKKRTVRVNNNENAIIGSGFIYSTNYDGFCLVFTAKHNLGTNYDETLLNKIIVEKQESDKFYPFKCENIIIDNQNDFAILLLKTDGIEKVTGPIEYLKLVNEDLRKERLENIILRGYPAATNNSSQENFDATFDENITLQIFKLKSSIELKSFYEDAFNNIKGLSGGGIICSIQSEIYLLGIIIEIMQFEKFKCFGFTDLNKIFTEENKCLKVQRLSKINHSLFVKRGEKKTKKETIIQYEEKKKIETRIKEYFTQYANDFFRSDPNTEIKKVEKKIIDYRDEFNQLFNEHMLNTFGNLLPDFKKKVITQLWTIKAALTTQNDELKRYKVAFNNSKPYELYETVRVILNGANKYTININNTDYLKFSFPFLEDENTYLAGVIGLGIRSELLHKASPKFFCLMTLQSLWGMYFFTNKSPEFIREEEKSGKTRLSSQWEYDYARFNYYSWKIWQEFKSYFEDKNIQLKEELRYGYVNLFLQKIFTLNKTLYKNLHSWKEL